MDASVSRRETQDWSPIRHLSVPSARKFNSPSIRTALIFQSVQGNVWFRGKKPLFTRSDPAATRQTLRNRTDNCARPDCPEDVEVDNDLYFVERLVGRKAVGQAGFLWLAKWDG